MRFIVVQSILAAGGCTQTIVNVDAIRFIVRCEKDPCYENDLTKSVICFNGHPDVTMYVVEDFEILRARLSDLELPMPVAT